MKGHFVRTGRFLNLLTHTEDEIVLNFPIHTQKRNVLWKISSVKKCTVMSFIIHEYNTEIVFSFSSWMWCSNKFVVCSSYPWYFCLKNLRRWTIFQFIRAWCFLYTQIAIFAVRLQDWDLVWSSIIRFKKCKKVRKDLLITFFEWWESYRAFLSSSCQAFHFHFGYVMTQDGHHFQTLFITSPVKSGMDAKKCEKEGEKWELFKRCIRPLSDLTHIVAWGTIFSFAQNISGSC